MLGVPLVLYLVELCCTRCAGPNVDAGKLLDVQHYIKLSEVEKNRKLNDLLDALDFNQVVIFVKSVSRAAELNKLLVECNFPSICIHSGMSQEERYASFLEG